MTNPREIIVRDLLKTYANYGLAVGERADLLIQSLTSAGFRILEPDEIDGPTVEKCAIRAKECFDDPQAEADPEYVSTSLRALKEKRS